MITPPAIDVVALSPFQSLLWCLYLVAAVALRAHHIPPNRRYLRGDRGMGDACPRSETLQCLWRLPALPFAVFIAPSLPWLLSIALDRVSRAGRILAMRGVAATLAGRAGPRE